MLIDLEFNLKNELKKKLIPTDKWDEERTNLKISRKEMNKLVFQYLIGEAKKEAVEAFEQETGEHIEYDRRLLEQRDKIRKHILKWQIDEAIDLINDINPEILESNTQVMFELQKHKFLMYLSSGKIAEAIEFAQTKLYQVAISSKELFAEFEKLMILFTYESIANSPFKKLVSEEHIIKIVSIVNKEILKFQLQPEYPGIQTVMKVLFWKQNEMKAKKISFPEIISLTPFKTEMSKLD